MLEPKASQYDNCRVRRESAEDVAWSWSLIESPLRKNDQKEIIEMIERAGFEEGYGS